MYKKIEDILKYEGVFSVVAKTEDLPHIVNSWNSFVIFKNKTLFVPVGGMNKMEDILKNDNRVIVVVGTRELIGLHGLGMGIKILGEAKIRDDISEYNILKEKYEWMRAVMQIDIIEAYQTV